MLALVSALTLTIAVVTTNNLVSARLAQQAGAAVNASDAGVAQAVTYLRQRGVRAHQRCPPTCATNPGDRGTPATVTVRQGGQSYKVWIEPIVPYPANKPGIYRIHSTGVAGGPAGRSVTVDVSITPMPISSGSWPAPWSAAATPGCTRVDLLHRLRLQTLQDPVQGIDEAYGIPAAAHTSQIITDSNGSGKTCPDTNKPIHDPTLSGEARYCNPAFPYDEDKFGGPLTPGGQCHDRATKTPATAGSAPARSSARRPSHRLQVSADHVVRRRCHPDNRYKANRAVVHPVAARAAEDPGDQPGQLLARRPYDRAGADRPRFGAVHRSDRSGPRMARLTSTIWPCRRRTGRRT